MWCAPIHGCFRCYSGLMPGRYAGPFPITGSFRVYPQYQDVALIVENFLQLDEIVALLRNARIPRTDVRHDNKKHTLVKKFFELAPDPPCPRQVLQVRFLERRRNFMPMAEVFQSFDAMQRFIHAMWPGGDEGLTLWTDFLDETRDVIRNVDARTYGVNGGGALIVPATVRRAEAVLRNRTRGAES